MKTNHELCIRCAKPMHILVTDDNKGTTECKDQCPSELTCSVDCAEAAGFNDVCVKCRGYEGESCKIKGDIERVCKKDGDEDKCVLIVAPVQQFATTTRSPGPANEKTRSPTTKSPGRKAPLWPLLDWLAQFVASILKNYLLEALGAVTV